MRIIGLPSGSFIRIRELGGLSYADMMFVNMQYIQQHSL